MTPSHPSIEDVAVSSDESASPEAPVDCEQRGFIDDRGREWIARTAIFDDSDGPPLRRDDGATAARKRPTEMSVEELAVAMMPLSLWGECEYTLAQPDLELAREAISKRGIEQIFDGYEGDEPNADDAHEEMSSVDRGVFGSDNREDRRDNTSFPFRSQIYVQTANDGGSATLIGSSAAVSAAHVVHTGLGWKSSIKWAPGADQRDTYDSKPRFPYKPGDSYPTSDDNNPMRSCKLISVPGGWVGDVDTDWDFAVFEFNVDVAGNPGCDERPGDPLGWFHWGFVNEANTDGKHGYIYGYPGESTNTDDCGDNYTSCVGSTCWRPTIWGWGNTSLDATTSDKLEFTIDITRGQSGAGVYLKNCDGTRIVIATLTGGWSPLVGADYNYARRINSEYIAFVEAYSSK